MGKMILFLLLCMSAVNCQAQQQNLKQKNKLEGYKKNDASYFIGTWKLTEKNYMDGNEKKIYPLQICMKQYTLKFVKENQNLFLIKNYAGGKDCTVKSSSDRISIKIEGGSFFYTDLDLKRVELYNMISKNKFSILYNDILNGKVTQTADVYERQPL